MTLLDRYLAKQFASALFKSLLALLALFVLIDLLTARRSDISNFDVPWPVVVQYYAAYTPWIVSQMAPLAVLISGLLVLGAAAQNREVTAALAGGISLRRFVRMPLLLSLGLAVLLYGMDQTAGARATAHARHLDERFFSKNPEQERTGVSWANLSGTWTCHILKFNRIALTGEDVLLDSIRDDAVEQIRAARIYWDPARGQWLLEDGRWMVFEPGVDRLRSATRITQRSAPFTEGPDQLFALEEEADTKTARELARQIRAAESYQMPVVQDWVDYYAKFSRPALCFVMIWLAIPFALRLRRGGLAIGFGVSIAVAITFLIVFSVGIGLGYVGHMPPAFAAWFADLLFLGVGVVLFWKTPT